MKLLQELLKESKVKSENHPLYEIMLALSVADDKGDDLTIDGFHPSIDAKPTDKYLVSISGGDGGGGGDGEIHVTFSMDDEGALHYTGSGRFTDYNDKVGKPTNFSGVIYQEHTLEDTVQMIFDMMQHEIKSLHHAGD